MLASYASEEYGQELQLEKSGREKEEQRSLYLLWIVILTVLGGIFIFYYFRQQIKLQEENAKLNESNRLLAEERLKTQEHEQRLLNLELQYKKKDLADMAIALSQKKERAEELYSRIIKVEKSKGKQRLKEFRELKEELQHQRFADNEIDYLQQNIDILSKEFYDKLKSSFPKLSKTEVKYCSFIKLNFSTTQIAQLQNISPKSVKMSRYRLKKKLGLDSEQNLDDFLQLF